MSCTSPGPLPSTPLQGPDLPRECVGAAVDDDQPLRAVPYLDYRGVLTWDPLGAPLRDVVCARCGATVRLDFASTGAVTGRHAWPRLCPDLPGGLCRT